jgi:membrane-associated phospholipid phosphatase
VNRARSIWLILFFNCLVNWSQPLLSQNDNLIPAVNLFDTITPLQSANYEKREVISVETVEIPDSILLRERPTFRITYPSTLITSPASDYYSLTKKREWILTSVLENQGKLWTSPFRIDKKDLLFWIPAITVSAITVCYDQQIYASFKRYQNNHSWVSDISPVITYGGSDIFVLSASGLIYLSGVFSGKEKAKQTGLLALQAWVNAGIIVKVGKLIFGRQRPSFEAGKDSWHGFPSSLNMFDGGPYSKYDAFPSGHTIVAWAFATVIAEQYKDIKIIPILSYSLATGVGLSRVTEDTHWLSDVIMGAALGYSIGKFVAHEKKDTRWTFLPNATGNNMKLLAVYKF